MKVVHISFWEETGGAAIATKRLHETMLSSGIDSTLVVLQKNSTENSIYSINNIKNKILLKLYNILSSRILKKYRPYIGNFSINNWGLHLDKIQLINEADIIYLHWINNSMISLASINRILKDKDKKVFIFLHDMYALTGGCHHSFECNKFTSHCQSCPILKSNKEKDISYHQFELKKKYLSGYDNLSIIAPSEWLKNCAQSSFLFSKNRIAYIPNLINQSEFSILEKKNIKNELGLNPTQKYLLFGADMGASNPYKGWSYLKDSLMNFTYDKEFSILVFGGECKDPDLSKKFNIVNYGYITSKDLLNKIYNAADVYIMPSLAEAFGQTAIEAMLCGTPVVAFKTGGLKDIIDHCFNGYLAEYRSHSDLYNGINWVLDNPHNAEDIRQSVISKFSSKKIIRKHINLIEST